MSLVKFTAVRHYLEDSPGEGFNFTYEGKAYTVEIWATSNASGQDIYNENGEIDPPFYNEADLERFQAELDAFKDAWMTGHALFVADAFEKAEKFALDASKLWASAYDADATKHGDSNDDEIEAWRDTAQQALSLLGMSAPDAPEPEED